VIKSASHKNSFVLKIKDRFYHPPQPGGVIKSVSHKNSFVFKVKDFITPQPGGVIKSVSHKNSFDFKIKDRFYHPPAWGGDQISFA